LLLLNFINSCQSEQSNW